MANLNINRGINDSFYRYKMPPLVAKIEGSGNGIKTVVTNMVDIAKCLSRPPDYPTKFFGFELGTQTILDVKNARYVVNGQHDAVKLQDLLDGFIKKFVLCPQCHNPETELVVDKKQNLWQKCAACGAKSIVDGRHKLSGYILKNPPSSSSLATTKHGSQDQANAEQGTGGLVTAEGGVAAIISNGSVEAGDSKKHKSSKHSFSKHSSHKKQSSKEEADAGEDEDDGDWSVDTSEQAVAARRNEMNATLGENVAKLTLSDELELPEKDRLEVFFKFAQSGNFSVNKGDIDRTPLQLIAEAERLEIKDKAAGVMVGVLFDENILNQIKPKSNYLLRFVQGNGRAQGYVLGALERLIIAYKGKLLPKVSHILKLLYDEDLLDEEVILKWASKTSKKYVSIENSEEIHKSAEKFVTWLRTADEDDDDEDEDEEEGEVEEEPTSAKNSKQSGKDASSSELKASASPQQSVRSAPVAAPAPANEEAADDLDIDNI